MKQIVILPFLLLIITPISAYAVMTPTEDGIRNGKIDAFGNVFDSMDACGKYYGTSNTQCHNAYDLTFNETCLSHPNLMNYRDTEPPEYPTCSDILHK